MQFLIGENEYDRVPRGIEELADAHYYRLGIILAIACDWDNKFGSASAGSHGVLSEALRRVRVGPHASA
jgi:hypothetical protein